MSQFPGDMGSVFLSGGGFDDYNPMFDMTPGAPGYMQRFRPPQQLGGIADMIRARDAKGARTPPRGQGGMNAVKNYRQDVMGRMPRPDYGRNTIPFVPPRMQATPQPAGLDRGLAPAMYADQIAKLPVPPGQPMPLMTTGQEKLRARVEDLIQPAFPVMPMPQPPRGGPVEPPIGIPGFPERPPGRFPQPGRKGQRNIPQPGGYYPQPPSSPTYPGQVGIPPFPSPGRKGNRGSYQQPQMPSGYGQMTYNPYQFSGYGRPQNMFGFEQPHYQPYQPPQYNEPYPMPSPQPDPMPDPMPGMPGPGLGGPGKGRNPNPGISGGPGKGRATPGSYDNMPVPGFPPPGGPGKGRSPGGPGKGNAGSVGAPAVEPPPPPAPPVRNRRSWFDVHAERMG